MGYKIRKVTNNGYRCCCHNTVVHEKVVEDRAKALSEIETTYRRDPDREIEEIEVTDESTGETIGRGNLFWPPFRDSSYKYSRWCGYVEDVPFEVIAGGQPGQTWESLLTVLAAENHMRKVREAERVIKAAQDDLARLKAKIPQGRTS